MAATRAPFSIEECACEDAYATACSLEAPRSLASSRATTCARCVASEALDWITPPPGPTAVFHRSGSPSRSTSQSSTWLSTSVRAGLVDHSIPCAPSAAATSSASTEGAETFAGKYANQPGDCQCVIPGRTTES